MNAGFWWHMTNDPRVKGFVYVTYGVRDIPIAAFEQRLVQAYPFVGLDNYKIDRIVFGNTTDPGDSRDLAYALAGLSSNSNQSGEYNMKSNRNFARNSRQAGFSLIELLIVVAIILIIAAIAIPNLLAAKRAANQAAAVGSLRTLVTAENSYRGNQTPPTYGNLTALAAADPNNNGESYVDKSWETAAASATGANGYVFADMTDDVGSATGFGFTAVPVGPTTGNFAYCVDEKGTIHQAAGSVGAMTSTGCDTAAVLNQ